VLRTDPYILDFSAYGAQCILHQERNYDRILKEAPRTKIDVYYRDRFYQWTTYPHIATQRIGYSNLVKKRMNHRGTFARSQKILDAVVKQYKTRKNKKTRTH
jgi:hypothetical protein